MAKQTEPAPSLDDLKARLLAGDDTVTAEQLARAAEIQQWEDLRRQAAELAAAEQAEAERTARFEALRARAQHIAEQRQQRDALAEQIRQAAADMVRLQDAMEAEQGAIIHALAVEGIRAGQEDHGIGWANANAYTRADHIRLDDQVVTAGNVRTPIEVALGGALLDAGKKVGYFGSIAPARPR